MIGIGQRVAGRFSVLAHTGGGAMGTIYLARDEEGGGQIALKVLRREMADLDGRERFAHESSVLGEIAHPSVARYVAHGVTEDGDPFLAMEWIEGQALADRLQVPPRPTFAETTALGAVLAGALAVCHEHGIVHRDLKPSNVMLRGGDLELPQIVDFGLARLSSGASLTVTGVLLGTPRFMAPEQIRDARAVDGRADVFSLGCILFECATGAPAFIAADAMAVMVKILLERAPRVREVCPTVPPALARWIDAALDPDAEKRPTAAVLARALAALDLMDQGPLSAPFEPKRFQPAVTAPSLGSEPIELAVAEPVSWTVPRPNGTFFGRHAQLGRLDALLDRERVTLSIWGPPGIGKSRLIIEALERRRRVEPALAPFFCELRRVRTRAELGREVARALAIEVDAEPAAAERAVNRALQARPKSLVVLDAADHLAPELGGFLETILARAPTVRVVLTSRERLDLDGVERIELGPLADGSGRSEGATLFIDRARAVVDEALPLDETIVEEIVAALSAIPLAIELAAGTIDVLGLEGLRARLSRGTESHEDRLATAMRDAIVDSYQQLPEPTRRALALAAVFPGPFCLPAARAVLRDDGGATIAQLRRKAFLSTASEDELGGEPRVWMLAPIRAFALQELAADERRAALDRHSAFYAQRADELCARLERTGSLDAQKRLGVDQAHFGLALEHCLAAENADVSRMVALLAALEPLLSGNGASAQLVTLVERVLARCGGEAPPRLQRIRARTFGACGRGADAFAELTRATENARRLHDAGSLGGLLLEQGVLRHTRGELAAARACYEEAIERLAAEGLERDEARALGNLGALRHDLGDGSGALSLYREAVALLAAVGDLRLHGIFLGNLALLEQEQGARDVARRHYLEAIAELEAYRDVRLLGVTLGNLAALDLEEGDADGARHRLERAHALVAQTSDARSQALCLARLGAVLARKGSIEEGEVRLARAERLVARRDSAAAKVVSAWRGFVDLARAELARASGDRDAGERHLAAAQQRLVVAEASAAESDDLRTVVRTLGPSLAAARASQSASG